MRSPGKNPVLSGIRRQFCDERPHLLAHELQRPACAKGLPPASPSSSRRQGSATLEEIIGDGTSPSQRHRFAHVKSNGRTQQNSTRGQGPTGPRKKQDSAIPVLNRRVTTGQIGQPDLSRLLIQALPRASGA